jgi:acetyltransferase-like isoleucine patch superfamily enzyme
MVNIIPFYGIFFYFCVAILIVVCFLFFLFLEAFIPGIIIRIFHIQVKEGEYDLSIKDKGFFTHLLFFMLYRPSLHLIGIIPLVPLRLRFLKLVGLTIGKHSMIAGTELIDEPYAVTIGDHTFIGGYTIIYTHLSFKKMINKPVCIGNNCFIGNKSVILPGVVIEDDVVVKPGSVVPSDQVLKQGGVYAGNPAKKISS